MQEIDISLIEKSIGKDSTSVVGNSHKTTTTPYYPATPYYIATWGHFNGESGLHIERVSNTMFLYNNNGHIGVSNIIVQEKNKSKINYFRIEDKDGNIKDIGLKDIQEPYYRKPSLEHVERYLNGEFKPRPINEILESAKDRLKTLYDFPNERDVVIWLIEILQSHLQPILKSFFFVGVDATKGGGKTTLLEIASILCRHGFVGGDTSAAAIPRLVQAQDLTIFFDEIDQRIGNGENESVAILRKGQRRGNPYIRCEGRDNKPKAYEVAGCHGFSFRSEVEDAFMSRTLITHTSPSMDNQLPVINNFKEEILTEVSNELFFWGIENLINLYKVQKSKRGVVGCSGVAGCSGTLKDRNSLYKVYTNHFNPRELRILSKLTGRNTELAFLILDLCNLVGFDVVSLIEPLFESRQKEDNVPSSFYLESLRDWMIKNYLDGSYNDNIKILQEGKNANSKYYPKNLAYQEWVQHLADLNLHTVGSKKYNSLLRDLGFQEGISIVSQRHGGYPKPCLIFTAEINEKLKPMDKINEESIG